MSDILLKRKVIVEISEIPTQKQNVKNQSSMYPQHPSIGFKKLKLSILQKIRDFLFRKKTDFGKRQPKVLIFYNLQKQDAEIGLLHCARFRQRPLDGRTARPPFYARPTHKNYSASPTHTHNFYLRNARGRPMDCDFVAMLLTFAFLSRSGLWPSARLAATKQTVGHFVSRSLRCCLKRISQAASRAKARDRFDQVSTMSVESMYPQWSNSPAFDNLSGSSC